MRHKVQNKKDKIKKDKTKMTKILENVEEPKYNKADARYKEVYYKEKEMGREISQNKKFRYAFPLLKSGMENKIKYIKDTERLQKKSFAFYNTGYFITCFDQNENFVCVGTRLENKLINIYEKLDGDSKVMIFDKKLNLIKNIDSKFGKVIGIKIDESDLYVLFTNGNLIKYPKFTDSHEEYQIVDASMKVILFDIKNSNIAYTDGQTLVINDRSRKYDCIIMQIVMFERYVIILDINGKVHKTDLEHNEIVEITSKYTINTLKNINGHLISFENQGYQIHDRDERSKEFLFFFSNNFNGLITSNKRYNKKTKRKNILQIYRNDESVCLDSVLDIKPDNPEKIIDIKTASDSFLFCTESGLIVRIYYF